MFQREAPRTIFGSAIAMGELVFHAAVRNLRKSHGNAVIGLLINILQTVMLVAVVYLFSVVLGLRSAALRGDYLLFVMSGVFMFMTHTKAIGAVTGADGPTAAMMMHGPMNTVVAILASALSVLYRQAFSAAVVLYLYHAAITPISIEYPVGMVAMFLLAWGTGLSIGLVFRSLTPWQPELFGILTMIFQRMNLIFSGKMLVANGTPAHIRKFFDWNPLFHIIDQCRGYVFLNYAPHYTTYTYPLKIMVVCLMVGLVIEYYTRKRVSVSWGAGK